MKKVKGLTNRIAAVFLSGLLVIGAVPGTVLASESPENLGQTSETAAEDTGKASETEAEDLGDTLSEEVSTEGYSEDAALQGEEAAEQYYTVTLDANGGYFENEWDDAIGEIVEQAQIVNKQIPVGGTVAAAPVFTEMDQDGQAMTFAGWSLEPDGELVIAGDEEYAPVDSCTLYAVWEAEDPSAGDVGSDTESQDIAEDNTDQIDAAQDSGEVDEAAEGSQGVQDFVDVDEAAEGSQGVQDSVEADEAEESAAGRDAWDNGTAEDSSADENPASEADTDPGPIDENEQAAASDQEAVYADVDAEKAGRGSSDAAISVEETQPELTGSSEEEENVSEDAANGEVESGTCGANLTWTLEEGTLTISGTGEMYDYEYITSPFADYDVKTVIIEDGVSDIGNYVFSQCRSMTRIEIPKSVTSIGVGAFIVCNSLQGITIPDSVTSIGSTAFSLCTQLTNIRIPNSVTWIGEGAFEGSRELASIELPDSITSISAHMFYCNYSMTSIELPKTVTSIGDRAFEECTVLTSITIPDSVTSIGDRAFYNCGSLTSITIPDSVTSIGEKVFEESPNVVIYGYSGSKAQEYAKENNIPFKILINRASVTVPDQSYTYTGNPLKPKVTVIVNGTQLIMGTDYEVAYSSNIDAGPDATVTVTGTGGYSGEKEITFTIEQAMQTITASDLSLTYPETGTINVSGNEGSLTYESSNTAIATVDTAGKVTAVGGGTAKITITAAETDNYKETTKEITVNVAKAAQTITASALSLTYPETGKITASGNKGSLTYKSSNTAVATVDSAGKVTAKGGGTAKITITAAATAQYNAASKTVTVNVAKAAQSITAKAAAPVIFAGQTTTVSVTGAKGTVSFKSSDSTIAAVDKSTGKVTAKKTGTVKITATSTATAQYNASSKTVTIKVLPAVTSSLTAANQATGIKLTWKKVTGATGYKIYRNSTLIKTITGDSTVTYVDTKANTNMTRYIYKVVAKGPAGDSPLARTVTAYRVNRPVLTSVTNSAFSVMTAKWTRTARATGYQIKYSTSKNFTSDNGTVSAYGGTTDSRRIADLKRGKIYYVKIRAYKVVGNALFWSEWSPTKTVRISK